MKGAIETKMYYYYYYFKIPEGAHGKLAFRFGLQIVIMTEQLYKDV